MRKAIPPSIGMQGGGQQPEVPPDGGGGAAFIKWLPRKKRVIVRSSFSLIKQVILAIKIQNKQ
jgi:hypothetical protein